MDDCASAIMFSFLVSHSDLEVMVAFISGGNMIFFTADTHFGHTNIVKHCGRPFDSVDEMDGVIIENWNKIIKKQDIVYHLGDFAWKTPLEYKNRLNGQIHLCEGNHDRVNKDFIKSLSSFSQIKIIKNPIGGGKITLCHYAMRTWYKSYDGYWHLYGHSHGLLDRYGKSMDVGVDTNHFKPYSIDEIAELI